MSLPVALRAKLEAGLAHALEQQRIAKEHRVVYMTLNSSASNFLREFVEYYISAGEYEEAINFIEDNYSDTIEKTLTYKTVLDKQDNERNKTTCG